KPHNKTPYELLHGRLPSIGFMRPFGYPVTILNTLDPLGKFQGKVDEGFLVGYSVCSKAFRIFNSRTRIIQETLHVNFMENKPNVAGSGPAWLFDIDSLSHTMNYHPVLAENQSNPTAVSAAGLDLTNSTNDFTAAGPLVSAAGPSNAALPNLEDLFHNVDDVGAETDTNNMESIILVSPIPTTRIHKDHPTLSQEDPKRIHQALKDPSWIEAMQDELLQFKMQKVWILVDLPMERGQLVLNGFIETKRMKES
nr:retrovirus-related Pol polyprotein from transposon TNT 1-94 [Tanacetum cinerariifolium]